MTPDTGARGPQRVSAEEIAREESRERVMASLAFLESMLRRSKLWDEWTYSVVTSILAEFDAAAGVGVPPPENQDLGGALHKERGDAREFRSAVAKLERIAARPDLRKREGWKALQSIRAITPEEAEALLAALASGASAAEGRSPKALKDLELAGVGEARPAEPPPIHEGDFPVMRDVAEQTLDGTLPYEESWHTNAQAVVELVAECARLREQLDAARQALGRIAGSEPKGLDGIHFIDDHRNPSECPGCVARAALGDVAAEAEADDYDHERDYIE